MRASRISLPADSRRRRAAGRLGVGEFVALAALLFSLVALSIDAMLPALSRIGADLETTHVNDAQLVIGVFFIGSGLGQLVFGPASDAFGRKRAIIAGLVLYLVGCVVSIFAWSFFALLCGRLLQGIGASAPRTVTVSMVRDLYQGTEMARILSIVMGIFILVPAVAPAIGQGVLWIAHWRFIFVVFLVMGATALVWLSMRQGETLAEERRIPLGAATLFDGVVAVCRSRAALGHTLAMGAIFGAFIGFLNSAQQIFQVTFEVGDRFALYFAVLALAIGAALFVNSRVVTRFGMRRIAAGAAAWCAAVSAVYLGLAAFHAADGLGAFMAWGILNFFCCGLIFGNVQALAMEPLGRVAGIGAAVVGFISTTIAILLAIPIGRAFDGTPIPMIAGFACLGALSFALMLWTGRARAAR